MPGIEGYGDFMHVELIQRDLFQASVMSTLWNLEPLETGEAFHGVRRMSEAAGSVIAQDENYELSAQLLRDWIFIAAFGDEALVIEGVE